jgi:hypothetical protein
MKFVSNYILLYAIGGKCLNNSRGEMFDEESDEEVWITQT